MDSCNSGSMQSSSGGDEEYDSHRGSISTFLNSASSFGSISSNIPAAQFLSHQSTFFDNPHEDTQNFNSNISFLDSSNSQYNINDLMHFENSSATHAILSTNQGIRHDPYNDSTNPIPIKSSNITNKTNVVKNPKKRSRATRRAPTTVLTTDTTNFRQMVQEFTGIPTAPFTSSSYTRRLELFSSTASSTMRSGHLDNLGPLYTQKVQNSPFVPPSSFMGDTLVMPTNNTSSGINNSTSIVDQSFTSTTKNSFIG